jgi:hypothetical protein
MDQIGGLRASQRIGSAERELAIGQLQQHYQAGRLTPEEYEDRSVRASKALTWAEITRSSPTCPSPGRVPVRVNLAVAAAARAGVVPLSDRARETIMWLTPLVA